MCHTTRLGWCPFNPSLPLYTRVFPAGEGNDVPAHVSGDWAVSRTFQILYRNEDVAINDVILYRFHTLINSNKVGAS